MLPRHPAVEQGSTGDVPHPQAMCLVENNGLLSLVRFTCLRSSLHRTQSCYDQARALIPRKADRGTSRTSAWRNSMATTMSDFVRQSYLAGAEGEA